MTDTLIRVLAAQLRYNTGPALILLALTVLLAVKLGPQLLAIWSRRRLPSAVAHERRVEAKKPWYQRGSIAEWGALAVLLAGAVKTILS